MILLQAEVIVLVKANQKEQAKLVDQQKNKYNTLVYTKIASGKRLHNYGT